MSGGKVKFVGEKEIVVKPGQTILQAALDSGIPHFHACGGNAECSTCRIIVVEGNENVPPPNEKEMRLRSLVPFPPKVRLACQTSVNGDATVQRIKVEKTDLSHFVKKQINDAQHKLGEKRELILFFLDIRNFTPFVETYLPYDAIHVLRSCYVIFNHWISSNNGVIIDTAGDGFYAVFGLDTNINDAAKAAINAGHEILKEMRRFNETFLDPYFGCTLEVGIGVHAGQSIVGHIEVGQASHLSVMGSAVNIASRIQNSTKRLNNNFLASEAVMRYVNSDAESEKRVIKLRGVRDVIEVHLIGEPYSAIVSM